MPELPVSFTPYKDQGESSSAAEDKENRIELPTVIPISRKPMPKRVAAVPDPAEERRKINQMLREKCKFLLEFRRVLWNL